MIYYLCFGLGWALQDYFNWLHQRITFWNALLFIKLVLFWPYYVHDMFIMIDCGRRRYFWPFRS